MAVSKLPARPDRKFDRRPSGGPHAPFPHGVSPWPQKVARGARVLPTTGNQVRSWRTRVLARTISLRMTATRATLPGLPRSLSLRYTSAKSGFQRRAATAGMYRSRRARARPPRMKARPCQAPDSRGTAANPARLAAALPLEGAQLGHLGQQTGGGGGRDPRDGGEDLQLAGPRLVGRNQLLQFAVDGAQVALEHVDLDLVLLFEQGFAELSAAVERGRALAHQRVPGRLQILEPALRFGRHLGPARLQRGGQLGQFPSVYGVGLGAAPGRLGEAPRLPGVHLGQRQLRFGQRLLEVPVVGAGGLVGDALDRSSDPINQRPEAGRVIVELGGIRPAGARPGALSRCRCLRYAVSSFLSPVLVIRALMPSYPFRTSGKTVADLTPFRFAKVRGGTVQPPPSGSLMSDPDGPI